jgi:hypothetical protein
MANEQSISANHWFQLTPTGELKVAPSATSSKHDFDFLIGSHHVHHKKLNARLNNKQEWIESEGTQEMRPLLDGLGDVDRYFMISEGKPFEGLAIRVFNPQTKLWSIYWADSRFGVLDPNPVVGSFENNIGYFFSKDKLNGKDILIKFKWDRTDASNPVWSQAFSEDNGKTWEWNWYMYFSRDKFENKEYLRKERPDRNDTLASNQPIKVLELRNYLTRSGQRDNFANFFEKNFTDAQSALGGYILGTFRNAEDNFFWMRGYHDMPSRSKYLPLFYTSDYWKQRRATANSMLLNNDNVYLLKPLAFGNSGDTAINSNEFGKGKGLVVIDYYIANTNLTNLISFFRDKYIAALKSHGINDITFWVSELTENDFPALPVFQDKNLLVTISHYNDEEEYKRKIKELNADKNMYDDLRQIMTTKQTLLLYPTAHSFIKYEK